MSKIVVVENVSLDGVMQAPGRSDEDLRDGFAYGGWALPYNDPVKGRAMAEGMAQAGPLLFGRRTYEWFAARWPSRSGALADRLNTMPKYVVSTTLTEPGWINSTVLNGANLEAAKQLKRERRRKRLARLLRRGAQDDAGE